MDTTLTAYLADMWHAHRAEVEVTRDSVEHIATAAYAGAVAVLCYHPDSHALLYATPDAQWLFAEGTSTATVKRLRRDAASIAFLLELLGHNGQAGASGSTVCGITLTFAKIVDMSALLDA